MAPRGGKMDKLQAVTVEHLDTGTKGLLRRGFLLTPGLDQSPFNVCYTVIHLGDDGNPRRTQFYRETLISTGGRMRLHLEPLEGDGGYEPTNNPFPYRVRTPTELRSEHKTLEGAIGNYNAFIINYKGAGYSQVSTMPGYYISTLFDPAKSLITVLYIVEKSLPDLSIGETEIKGKIVPLPKPTKPTKKRG
jgi:hypothetical protein